MTPEFMCDALDDLHDFYSLPFESDPELVELFDAAANPPSPLTELCAMLGVSVDFYFQLATQNLMMREASCRLHTGYLPKLARTERRHVLYVNGLRTPEDKTARDMREMGLRR